MTSEEQNLRIKEAEAQLNKLLHEKIEEQCAVTKKPIDEWVKLYLFGDDDRITAKAYGWSMSGYDCPEPIDLKGNLNTDVIHINW